MKPSALTIQATNHHASIIQQLMEHGKLDESTANFIMAWLQGNQEFELHTSGSTGPAKSIRVSRKAMEASAKQTLDFLNIQPGQHCLVCLNTHYIGGKMMLVRALIGELSLTMLPPVSNPLELLAQESPIDFMALVPLQIESILASEHAHRLNEAKAIIVGGAAISYSLAKKIQTLSAPVYSTYGMTETVSHIALQRINGPAPEDYYTTLGDTEIWIDDRSCLCIRSTVTEGETIVTNDLVEMMNAKQFKWIGRADFVINSGGIKVNPEQVEQQLEALFAESKLNLIYFVAGLPDQQLGQKVVLLVEGGADASLEAKIQSLIQDITEKYWRPRQIIFISKFVYTETNKINRNKTINELY